LLEPAHQVDHSNIEHEQLNRARQDAEALFRPRPNRAEPSIRSGDAAANQASARKPRILSAITAAPDGAAAILEQPAVAPLSTPATRDRLSAQRREIVGQQQKLQAKLETIDAELRAIAAYEAAKQTNDPVRHHRR